MEYAWFSNVETKPGIGYPKDWENQARWKDGRIFVHARSAQCVLEAMPERMKHAACIIDAERAFMTAEPLRKRGPVVSLGVLLNFGKQTGLLAIGFPPVIHECQKANP